MTIEHTAKILRSCNPVRNIKKARGDGFHGITPWYELTRLMEVGTDDVLLEPESKLESDFLLVKRFDRSILKMRHQPKIFEWWDPRVREYREHTPDFEGATAVDLVYFQIKTDEEELRLREELKLIGESIEAEGHRFEVWKKSDIHKNPRFRNCELFCEEAGPIEDREAVEAVEKLVSRAGRPLPIGVIRRATKLHARAFRAVLRLYVLGEIDLDVEQFIDDSSIVHQI
jgi:hypothetical protein